MHHDNPARERLTAYLAVNATIHAMCAGEACTIGDLVDRVLEDVLHAVRTDSVDIAVAAFERDPDE